MASLNLDVHAFILLPHPLFYSSPSISDFLPPTPPAGISVSLIILHELPFSGTACSHLKRTGTAVFFQCFLRGFFPLLDFRGGWFSGFYWEMAVLRFKNASFRWNLVIKVKELCQINWQRLIENYNLRLCWLQIKWIFIHP